MFALKIKMGGSVKMTEKALQKLKRTELLELLLYLEKELESVKKENASLQQQLETQAAATRQTSDELLCMTRKMAQQVTALCQHSGVDPTCASAEVLEEEEEEADASKVRR
jgi:hypothetical protein